MYNIVMSEKSTTTTSFINKPPLSSDSSIDSGCNLSTSDSMSNDQIGGCGISTTMSNYSTSSQENQINTNTNGNRMNSLLMLPPQPNVPPPPPPLELCGENDFPETHDNIYDINHTSSIYQPFPLISPSTNNSTSNLIHAAENSHSDIYASQTPSGNTSNNYVQSSPQVLVQTNQQLSSSVQQPSSNPQTFQQTVINQRSSTSSLGSNSSVPLMPMNVKGMLLHGLPSEEVLRNWLHSIKCDDHIQNFIYHGYDIHLVTRMTPQDLAAIGCKTPALRKKLLTEIKKLNLDYDIPEIDAKQTPLDKWLESLKLNQYHSSLVAEGYNTIEKVCQLVWEDFEELGITKLGHQKRLLLAIDKLTKLAKLQADSQNDNTIYDVHPNHRVSLNGAFSECRVGTIGRVRSGFFQTRSGANLDHRGLPIATVMPALKHVSSPLVMNSENKQVLMRTNGGGGFQLSDSSNTHITMNVNGGDSNSISSACEQQQQIYESNIDRLESLKLDDLGSSTTMKRVPPPLPPVRTNSLKVPQNDNMIYGQTFYAANEHGLQPSGSMNGHNSSTSFLRTPRLGTLTATTNKMLASGGHIQALNGIHQQQQPKQSMLSPVRVAPLPPQNPNR